MVHVLWSAKQDTDAILSATADESDFGDSLLFQLEEKLDLGVHVLANERLDAQWRGCPDLTDMGIVAINTRISAVQWSTWLSIVEDWLLFYYG